MKKVRFLASKPPYVKGEIAYVREEQANRFILNQLAEEIPSRSSVPSWRYRIADWLVRKSG